MSDLGKTAEIMQTMDEENEESSTTPQPEASSSTTSTGAPRTDDKHATAPDSTDSPPPTYESATAHLRPDQKPTASDSKRRASPSPARSSGTSTPRPGGIPSRLAIEQNYGDSEALPSEKLHMSEQEKKLRDKQKKNRLTKEQREELAAFEQERKKKREERVSMLNDKLIQRISVWTESEKSDQVTQAFRAQIALEIENLKMESFGIEILHAIGVTYTTKGTQLLKSQKLFGISGFWSRVKEKGALAKETWSAISTAIDAQMSVEEMVKMEERGGDDWTDEAKAEMEKRVTGKILAAAWRASKFEIQSVLREVCERVLGDKSVPLSKRIERAQALVLIGDMFSKVWHDFCWFPFHDSCRLKTKRRGDRERGWLRSHTVSSISSAYALPYFVKTYANYMLYP